MHFKYINTAKVNVVCTKFTLVYMGACEQVLH